MSATTLDEVIAALTAIIDDARTGASRSGYFAVVYRMVTHAVKAGITDGRFEDGPRMEHLDVIFANRYLEAHEQYQRGEPCSVAWQVVFDSVQLSNYLVLQHILLGINAHINLDLGIAAAQAAPGAELDALEHDFMEINAMLASLVKTVQMRIGTISPWLGWLDYVGGRTDEAIVNFSMEKARQSAWAYAQKLNRLNADEQANSIAQRDQAVADLASIITRPGLTLSTMIFLIWLRESREVTTIIDLLLQE